MSTKLRFSRALFFTGALLAAGAGAVGLTTSPSFAADVTPGTNISVNNAPYATAGKACDTGRDGYHFIINQLAYPAGSVIDGNDFGPITITFSNGTTAVASFTDLSGNSTAHFINTSINQTGNFTITSASMTFPALSDITSYGNFVISHPPCGTVSTEVTTPTTLTPTTVTPTTVTPTTATPTTEVGSEGPVPTTTSMTGTGTGTDNGTATTSVDSAGPFAPTAFTSTDAELPSTGTASSELAFLGAAFLGFGLIGMALARRSRPATS